MRLSVSAAARSDRGAGADRFCSCCSPPPRVVFVIACSNVANLILARSVRREGELAVRAALGASRGALRRTLLAESLVLCGAGAVLGVLLARPLVAVVARFAARFSVRALDVTVDASLLWVGAGAGDGRGRAARLRAAAAVAAGPDRTGPRERQRPHHAGHQPPPARVRDHADRVLVRAAGRRRHAARHADRAADGATPATTCGRCWRSTCRCRRSRRSAPRRSTSIEEVTRRIGELPGVEGVVDRQLRAVARRRHVRLPAFRSPPRATRRPTAKRIRARGCASSRPASSTSLGVPLVAGRDFTADDRRGSEPVVIVSQSVAQRLFPNGDALNRQALVDRSVLRPSHCRAASSASSPTSTTRTSCRGPAMTVYHPLQQMRVGGPAVRARAGDPYALVPPVTRIIREHVARTSRSSAPRRSRTCARKCWRPSGSTRSCSPDSPASRC